jgi:hypothetical protein
MVVKQTVCVTLFNLEFASEPDFMGRQDGELVKNLLMLKAKGPEAEEPTSDITISI